MNITSYRSVSGKRPWALKHKSRFWPAWALIQDQNSIRLYRNCYSDPLKCSAWAWAWALTREWAPARDAMVIAVQLLHNYYSYSLQTLEREHYPNSFKQWSKFLI